MRCYPRWHQKSSLIMWMSSAIRAFLPSARQTVFLQLLPDMALDPKYMQMNLTFQVGYRLALNIMPSRLTILNLPERRKLLSCLAVALCLHCFRVLLFSWE